MQEANESAIRTGMNSKLSDFYQDWYSNDGADSSQWGQRKRKLTAQDAVASMTALLGKKLGRLVDVGAGDGSVLNELAEQGLCNSLTALEISQSGIDFMNSRNIKGLDRIEQFDGYVIPSKDEEFDTAISVHVLEHVEHERQFISELSRVAKRCYIEVPLEGGLLGRINRKYGHINYYSPLTILNLLETSGVNLIGWRVFTSSRELEAHHYGSLKGAAKNILRRGVLNILGEKVAPHVMTYLMGLAFERNKSGPGVL
jgi:SAM-dependent methyltransferase